jgi:nucleoside-diphosphate-sugar epimerase
MRVTVIGGTGHVGGYLVPRLVAAGHEVTVVTRGKSAPYREHGAWRRVETVVADRDAEDAAGTFGERIAGLRPDVVIDMICFTEESARQLAEAVRGRVAHLLHCGTIWVHGPSLVLPTTEAAPRRPFGDYGVRKAAIEEYLLDQAHRHGLPVTLIHPGHITGPGWVPVNPAANLDPAVFQRLLDGDPVALPNLGLETLQHVHADDVAALFTAAMESRSAAVGESFHSVGATTLTLRGYAEAVASWYGRDADLTFQPYDRWKQDVPAQHAQATWDHIAHSPHCSMAKAERLLGYRPRYGALAAIQEAVAWLVERGQLTAPR